LPEAKKEWKRLAGEVGRLGLLTRIDRGQLAPYCQAHALCSTPSAGLALYLLVADGEPGAKVYSAATSRDQARIVFDEAKRMTASSPAASGDPMDGEQRRGRPGSGGQPQAGQG
jgi:Phage terminase, small subunit